VGHTQQASRIFLSPRHGPASLSVPPAALVDLCFEAIWYSTRRAQQKICAGQQLNTRFVIYLKDESRGGLVVMERRRIKYKASLEELLANEAKRLRKQAKTMLSGAERDDLIRRARQNETAADRNAWLTSLGLVSPK
jgi:hypothetical protein